ncbi:E3 ubiquitin-protein ligase TRIM45-like [Saccostrea cucullata]|uniref:E3 ubiquitin-protein ligase TRIM45-like n=1 Tax=Saccostrea cuccullata TaxID=36930 RepID=UPI002ED64FA7
MTSRGQYVITCDLCDKPTKQFCQVSLCVDCVSNHVDKHQSLTHDIVPFKSRKIQLVFPECEFHPHQRCEAHCQQCDVPVCIKCFLSNHKGHNAIELSKIVVNKMRDIETETEEIEIVILPRYMKVEAETKVKASECSARYNELEQNTQRYRELWHKNVDIIFNNLSSSINSKKNDMLTSLNNHQTLLSSLILEIQKTIERNKEILKTNKVSQVINYESKLKEYRSTPSDINIKIPSLETNTIPGVELNIELEEYRAILTQTSISSQIEEANYYSTRELLDKARVVATIPTAVKPIWRVACVGDNAAWVSGDDILMRLVDIHGFVQDIVKTTSMEKPSDITVSRQGRLVYSDAKNKTVNIVRYGQTEVMLTIPKGWKPRSLCCTRLGDILVNLYNGGQNKIVRYQGKTLKQEIYKDDNNKDIFKTGEYRLCIAENNNGDICASDLNADIVIGLN